MWEGRRSVSRRRGGDAVWGDSVLALLGKRVIVGRARLVSTRPKDFNGTQVQMIRPPADSLVLGLERERPVSSL